MDLPNIFTKPVSDAIIARIKQITPETAAVWGKMNAAQMFAHCNVTYEMMYEDKHSKPGAFMRFILKMMVKKSIVTTVPYKKNSQTAPQFLIKDEKNFETEQNRLINYITKTQELGEGNFDGKASHSFGILNKNEWNTMLYKHLDHHLRQFGV